MTQYKTAASTLLVWCLLLGCASPWVPPEPEPPELRELRPKLANLKQGMSETETFKLLGLDSSKMEPSGCLHEQNYARFYERNYILTIHFDCEGTNGLALGWGKITTFKRREEVWPK
ncbi:MAG: hypothetical protein WCO56_21035 [Verrucomicrobiota bacterium]